MPQAAEDGMLDLEEPQTPLNVTQFVRHTSYRQVGPGRVESLLTER